MKCVCGKEFEPKRPWQRYHAKGCGDKVRQERRKKRVRKALRLVDSLGK